MLYISVTDYGDFFQTDYVARCFGLILVIFRIRSTHNIAGDLSWSLVDRSLSDVYYSSPGRLQNDPRRESPSHKTNNIVEIEILCKKTTDSQRRNPTRGGVSIWSTNMIVNVNTKTYVCTVYKNSVNCRSTRVVVIIAIMYTIFDTKETHKTAYNNIVVSRTYNIIMSGEKNKMKKNNKTRV